MVRLLRQELSADPNQVLIVGRVAGEVVSSRQLTLIPNLTHERTKRAQIECVRVDPKVRGKGYWTKQRIAEFYGDLGFVNFHHGMKL